MSHLDYNFSEHNNLNSALFNWCKVQGTAVGADSITMVNSCQSLSENIGYSATELLSNPFIKFYSLKIQWENDTRLLSSTNEICMHPDYQQIIGMGKEAIQFIMDEILQKPSRWFWALKSITGQDPVPISKRGKAKEMAKEWLSWWAKNRELI